MAKLPALLITLDAVKRDPALVPGNRGARKVLITGKPYDTEKPADDVLWEPSAQNCPVQIMDATEMAIFTHLASQDRHYHKAGTEIYMVLEGEMVIEVEGVHYPLAAGDVIVVNPWAVHEVKPRDKFLCRVITLNCGGPDDKFVVDPTVTRVTG